mmetsp:Transcript_25842/g.74449  ORF Transcript_25842/g.74449 Transcript_25842/m.74449 type:complete len:761 (+) Transcript_25842:53-2335(+)
MGAGHAAVGSTSAWDLNSCAIGSQCACLPKGSLAHEDVTEPSPVTCVRDEYINTCVDDYRDDEDSDGSSASSRSLEEDDRKDMMRRGADVLVMRHRVFSSHMRFRFHDHYRIERLLGEGSYGNVYEAVTLNPANGVAPSMALMAAPARAPLRHVAVKCFAAEGAEGHPDAGRDKDMSARRASFERERSILSGLEHPHIVKMFECFDESDRLWIVLELCRGGEVYECIADQVRVRPGRGLDESLGQTFFRQMLQAVTYLHSWQIVHRDIKTENFLLVGSRGTPAGEIVKLCDFGTAVRLSPEQPRAMERIGTLSYAAPEVYAKRGATTLADIWSLGVVLYVMMVGASPFRITGEEPAQDTIDRIAHGRFDTTRPAWLMLSMASRDLICQVIVVDERCRLTGAAALRHSWVAGAAELGASLQASLTMGVVATTLPSATVDSPRAARHDARLARLSPHARGVLTLAGKFARLDLLQQLVIALCVQMTPDVELPTLTSVSLPWYDLFCALDRNEDGRLDFAEFIGGMQTMLVNSGGCSDRYLLALAKALDVDCSGAIDWVEWMMLALLSVESVSASIEPLQTAFRVLDRPSSDGSLGIADLLAVIGTSASSVNVNGLRGAEERNGGAHHARDAASRLLGRWSSSNLQAGWAPAAATVTGKSAAKSSKRSVVIEDIVPALGLADLRRALRAATAASGACMVDEGPQDIGRAESVHSGDETSDTLGIFGSGLFVCCEGERAQQVLVQHETVFLSTATRGNDPKSPV